MIHAAITYVSAMPALDAVPYVLASVPALTILMLTLAMCAHGLTSALEYALAPDVTAYLQDAADLAVDACVDAWTWIVDGTADTMLERMVLEGEIVDTRIVSRPVRTFPIVIDAEIDRSAYAVARFTPSWGTYSDAVQTTATIDPSIVAYARKIADRLDAARALARRSDVRRRDAKGRFMPKVKAHPECRPGCHACSANAHDARMLASMPIQA